MTYFHTYTINKYKITIVGDHSGITQLMVHNNTRNYDINPEWKDSAEIFVKTHQQLEEYFNGKRKIFDLELNPKGTPYQQKVWLALQNIPYGHLQSYKDIANALGDSNASRAIGLANNRNPIPIIVPCHRVVGSNGKMMSYAFGIEMKRDLIEMEAYHSFFKP